MGDAEATAFIRSANAYALSVAALESSRSKKARKAARRYLDAAAQASPGSFGAGVSCRPFAELKAEAEAMSDAERESILASDTMGRTVMRWMVAVLGAPPEHKDKLTRNETHCFVCDAPFADAPAPAVEVVMVEDFRFRFVGGLCAVCAVLPEPDKGRRLVEVVGEFLKAAHKPTLQ
jgi:hypothetical protein